MNQLEAHVHGLVQGVFFRYSTQCQAQLLGLVGWVENTPDGSVHVIAEGRREALEALLAWLHVGPELATVSRVEATWHEATHAFTGFAIRR